MSSIVKPDIGHDVSEMVTEIHSTSRVRDNTWAKNRDKEGRRRTDTMGYQISLEID
jgi:hypothetical protein